MLRGRSHPMAGRPPAGATAAEDWKRRGVLDLVGQLEDRQQDHWALVDLRVVVEGAGSPTVMNVGNWCLLAAIILLCRFSISLS
jgi:hypothetical protein